MAPETEAKTTSRDWRIALITVPVIMGLGWLSSWLSDSGYGNPWFEALDKPAFMPPGWAFGVVWPILYAMLGVALAIIISQPGSQRRNKALILFFAQLALNYAWTPIFFAAQEIQLAFITILVMIVIAATAAGQFWRIRPLAGALMLPYLAWLCFAAVLNTAFDRLNPSAGSSLLG